ncbi:hypothetical protein [Nocardia sp. SC052]|uniref:hypothetical protein n=1 Tax=Nocardia sichangensis TaxID=3385975 RepID=UPI0039A2C238
MGILDNLGDFEGEIRSHSDSIDTRLDAARRAMPAAATAIAELLGEAIDILNPYTYGPPGQAQYFGEIQYGCGVRLWGLPIVVADRADTLRLERRGRGWCTGTWSSNVTTILGEDGSITYPSVKRLAAPEPATPSSKPRKYGWDLSITREYKDWKKGADHRRKVAERAAAQDAEWQQLLSLGLQPGDLYFEVRPGSAPMLRPNPDQLLVFTYEGGASRRTRPRVGQREGVFRIRFSDGVRTKQYQRNKKDPAGYIFVSDSPKLRSQVPQRGGPSFGVFDDGMPVLVHYNKAQSTGLSSIREMLYAWNLEKTLTQRIQCIVEEFASIQR